MNSQPQSIPLTSTDCFFLALEKHDHGAGTSGSTCRYVLELEGEIDVPELEKRLNQNAEIQWLTSLTIEKSLFSIPRWESRKSPTEFAVQIHQSDDLIPIQIMERKFSLASTCLFAFDAVSRSNGNSALIFSWHHLLMDGYGALSLLKRIYSNADDPFILAEPPEKIRYTRSLFWETTRLFLWHTLLFWAPLSHRFRSGIRNNRPPNDVHQQIRVIPFSEEETELIDKKGNELGARMGKSPFFLAAAAVSIKTMLEKKGKSIRGFWVPVPQDQRKKGALGPFLGNHLSFLFYTLKKRDLNNFSQLIASLNEQMKEQIRRQVPKAYDALMRGFRRIPSGLYYFLIKGSRGNTLASFLFTLAADHPADLMNLNDLEVKQAVSLPPNTYPPGFTVAFMRFDGRLQLILMYYREVWTEAEIMELEEVLRDKLMSKLA